jgi:hypothetical protein
VETVERKVEQRDYAERVCSWPEQVHAHALSHIKLLLIIYTPFIT